MFSSLRLHQISFLNNVAKRFKVSRQNSTVITKLKSESKVVDVLQNKLGISHGKAEFLYLKYPAIRSLTEGDVNNYIKVLNKLGYNESVLTEVPTIFAALPITIEYRYQVLRECGFWKIPIDYIVSFLKIIRTKTIGELKESGCLPKMLNIENQIAGRMTHWPTSLTTLLDGDPNAMTLFNVRLNIIQRYLELTLDLQAEEFHRGIITYPTIKHRPVSNICDTLTILLSQFMIPNHKIKSNFYLLQADPQNLRNLLYKLKSIGGVDIKEVIRLYPKIALKNYETLVEIKNILSVFGVSDEAQVRCLEIYTLGPDTIRERLTNAQSIPEFKVYVNHPRFLRMIYYNNTATSRLRSLYDVNKKCLSLHILSGSTDHFCSFEKAPGDRSGKGKDLLFCLSQNFGREYSTKDIRKLIIRHPFWINIPIVQVDYVFKKLLKKFTKQDIFENCTILLYPWNKVNGVLKQLNSNKDEILIVHYKTTLQNLNNSQILSLALYILEKNHHFSGDGVWTEQRKENIESPPNLVSVGI